ncbi:uncharacterized protein LOC101859143 [Aplysia californica]|uniref:Uncharacterized protein LOC101859143 n=1 Tax=Aplysia californica TaxID=6500 RepID=A0ABM0JCK8_APLCA|nr:uncharacterized protein LOC101859143 [Aplysia californica]
MLSDGVVLLHDNATPHKSAQSQNLVASLGWELLKYPSYSPNLAPSDFHLFLHLKKFLTGQDFDSDADLTGETGHWLTSQAAAFCDAGIQKRVPRYDKCLYSSGDYVEKPTGIKLVWTIAATDSPVQGNPNALFSSGNRKDFEDNLKNMLNTLGPSFMGNLNINGFNPQTQLNPTQIATDAGAQVQDPCSSPDACPLGYENCRTVGFGDSTCSHKCEKFEEDRACEHGSLCELDANNEPFCSCGKNWEGKYCENDRNRLDPGEITGIVLGAMAMCIGLMGCCCWFLICRKRSQKHLKYTHYSDDLNGNDNFSNPSSKLTNYVIARPAVSVDPIQVFQPSAPPPDAFSVA